MTREEAIEMFEMKKEELIKALQYDRNQYTKGYKDGRNDILDKVKAEIKQITDTM